MQIPIIEFSHAFHGLVGYASSAEFIKEHSNIPSWKMGLLEKTIPANKMLDEIVAAIGRGESVEIVPNTTENLGM